MEEEVGFKMAIGMEPLHLTRGTRGGESVKWRGGSFHDRQSNSNVRTHLQGWYDFGKKQKLCGLTASSHGHVIALNAVSWWHGLGPQDAQIALGGGGSGSSDGRVALPCHPLLGKLGHRPVAGTGQHLVLPAAAFALRDKHAEVADGVPIRPHPPPPVHPLDGRGEPFAGCDLAAPCDWGLLPPGYYGPTLGRERPGPCTSLRLPHRLDDCGHPRNTQMRSVQGQATGAGSLTSLSNFRFVAPCFSSSASYRFSARLTASVRPVFIAASSGNPTNQSVQKIFPLPAWEINVEALSPPPGRAQNYL